MAKRNMLVYYDDDGHKVKVKFPEIAGQADPFADEFVEGLLRIYKKAGYLNRIEIIFNAGDRKLGQRVLSSDDYPDLEVG